MIKLILYASMVAVIAFPGTLFAQGCMGGGGDEEGVKVAGFFQPQIEYMRVDDAYDEFSFTINRARIAWFGVAPYDIEYYMCMEFSPFHGNPGVLDGIITYTRLGEKAKISMGQFKSPFSLEQNTACHKLHTINRSKVVSEMAGPIRDLGMMLFGKPHEKVSYNVAMMNGTGAGEEDDNRNKDYVARVVLSPFEGVNFGGSYRFGKSAPAATGVEDEDEVVRYGAELEVEHGNFLLQGEYIYGEDTGSYTTGGGCGGDPEVHIGSVDREGYFFQGLYMTEWNLQPVVKYEYYEPNFDADDDVVETITFGFNYFINDWTRLQLNYLYECEEVEVMNDELLMQLQVRF